jgi:hypothetical protein
MRFRLKSLIESDEPGQLVDRTLEVGELEIEAVTPVLPTRHVEDDLGQGGRPNGYTERPGGIALRLVDLDGLAEMERLVEDLS